MRHVVVINSEKMEPVRLLAAEPDVHLSALVKPKYAGMYEGLATVYPVDDVADVQQAADAVLQILRVHPVDAIVCPLERSLLTGGYIRSYLGLSGMSYEQALGFANKMVMKQRMRGSGIPVTGFDRLDRLEDVPDIGGMLGWPLVLKPAVGSGGMNTLRVESPEHFARMQAAGALLPLEKATVPLLAERFVRMKAEYHCDGVVQDGQTLFAAVSRYNTPVLSGMGGILGSYLLLEETPQVAPIRVLHQQVVTALRMENGVTHLEVFETDEGFVVGEITCRPGGGGITHNIERQSGVSLWKAFVRTALGDPAAFTTRVRPGVFGWCGLPCRNGKIVAMSPPSELASIPGVEEIQLQHGLGDTVAEKVTSVFYSGMLSFRVESEEHVARLLEEVAQRYYIEVVPADA